MFNGLLGASSTEVTGLAAAGSAALLWACSSVLYGRAGARMTAPWMNFTKGLIACGAFTATLLALGKPLVGPILEQPATAVMLLGLSGFIGIAIGDTAYFACIRELGARVAALIGLLSVPAAAAGGLIFLGERLPLLGWVGMAVTLGGVTWVVLERRPSTAAVAGGAAGAHRLLPGLALGLVAAVCQAAGALVNRAVVRDGAFDDLWTATWRLTVATVALAFFLPLFPRKPVNASEDGRFWRYLLPAMLMGTYAGIWLQQAAFSRADTGYVQTLLSTTPIWIIPIAMLTGDRVTWRAVVGSIIGLAGVALLIFSSR